jgi:hypothetical protein
MNIVLFIVTLPGLAKASICLGGSLVGITIPLLKHTIQEPDGTRKWIWEI